MEATLDEIQNIEKLLLTSLPAPPVWKMVFENLSGDIETDVMFKYPTFKGSNQPLVTFKVHTIHDRPLLHQLVTDTKPGFHPPYQFTLVRGNDPFFDKKTHTNSKMPWSKGEWVWSPKFSCNQLDAKTGQPKPIALNIDSLITQKVKKKTKLIAVDRVASTTAAQEAMIEVKARLYNQFSKALIEKADTYEKFLYYCGLSQLQFIDKQRKKVESQLVDVYQNWMHAFPGEFKC